MGTEIDISVKKGRTVRLRRGELYAGFIYSAGSCGELKTYALFGRTPECKGLILVELCDRPTKQALGKLLYYARTIVPFRTTLADKTPIALFFGR